MSYWRARVALRLLDLADAIDPVTRRLAIIATGPRGWAGAALLGALALRTVSRGLVRLARWIGPPR